MANSHTVLSVLAMFILVANVASSFSLPAGDQPLMTLAPLRRVCTGTISQCLAEEELEMDSDINRRILATSSYISYEALKKNSVPCNRRGSSYYNCRPGAQANPYSRGCSRITKCRS